MALPLQIGTEISRVLRSCGCRDFFFNELTEGGAVIGAFVLTPDFSVPNEAKGRIGQIMRDHSPLAAVVRFFSRADTITTTDAVVCRGSWMLRTACGHCSRCAEEAPRAFAALHEQWADALQHRVVAITHCIPPPNPNKAIDFNDATKVKFFEAARAELYDENGKVR